MSTGVARVYADALFAAAEAEGRLDEVQRDLANVVRTLAESDELVRVLFNPAFPHEAKARVLRDVAKGADPLVSNAVVILHDRGRLELLADVQETFAKRWRETRNEIAVDLTTAIEIDAAQAERLSATLADATGKHVQMTRSVDPAILGGVVLQIGDRLFDSSIRTRLNGLRNVLKTTRLPA